MKKNAKLGIPKTVDEYLKRLPADQRKALQRVREIIKENAPKAEEVISYHMPGYKYHGHLLFFAAFKNHLSLFAVNKKIMQQYEKELAPFKSTNSTIHFTPENQLPAALLKKIVKIRVKENESRLGFLG
jgi:uncharacterized protein YdhG (YjbR/CyaY superfamily)